MNQTQVRKLASVEVIRDIQPIEGYDKLQLVTVQGWQVVMNIYETLGIPFKEPRNETNELKGTKVIFFEVDAVFPEDRYSQCDFWKFLKKTYMGGLVIQKDFKNGIISQGMILPLSFLENDYSNKEEGTIVTKELGILKFYAKNDPERPKWYKKLEKKPKHKKQDQDKTEFLPFPEDILEKTDQLRVQSHLDLLEKAGPDRLWTATQKFDGTSVQFFFFQKSEKERRVGICSRNREVNMVKREKFDADFFHLNEKYQILKRLEELGLNISIQGECYGHKINGNRHQLAEKEIDLVVFDIFDIDTKKFWSFDRVETLMSLWKIPTVPKVFEHQTFSNDSLQMVKQLETISNQQKLSHGGFCEGIVVHTSDNKEPHVHFKVLSGNYKMKQEDITKQDTPKQVDTKKQEIQ